MSGFRAVNTTLTVTEPSPRLGEDTITTPTTPRAARFVFPERPSTESQIDEAAVKTPTKESFAVAALHLPVATEAPSQQSHARTDSKISLPRAGISREGSHRSTKSLDSGSGTGNSPDIDMKREHEDAEVSDTESVHSESGPPSKKKKGQRFFCTDFPPCQLSFTRSEHLARHIRKHTGERPFQCHCGRRFSRLDNLRQHAQTVHVNEDIPQESLAATGTRFQRQIRTDRVRPPTARSRASTFSSQSSHSRGHSRNLSASSITSVSTTTSSLGDDFRSRPSSLIDSPARSRLSIETYNSAITGSPGGIAAQQYYAVGGQSPSGYSTPTSTTFSTGTGSPRFSSSVQSPIAPPRHLAWGARTPARRLSVPSSNPFQAPPNSSYPASYITPLSSFAPSVASGQSSLYASPTSSNFEGARRDSAAAAAAEEWRRRTWHPSTRSGVDGQRPADASLHRHQLSESAPRSMSPPKAAAPAPAPVTRLPGIESFDHAPPQPTMVRPPSPMDVDLPARPALVPALSERRIAALPARRHQHHVSWDTALHRGLTKLDLSSPAQAPPPMPQPSWRMPPAPTDLVMSRQGTTPNPGFQSQALHVQAPTSAPQPIQPPPPSNGERIRFSDEPTTPRRNKRHAWYNGPIRESPAGAHHLLVTEGGRPLSDDSASSEGVTTPSSAPMADTHPTIVHYSGYSHDGHYSGLHTVPESPKAAFASGPGPVIIENEQHSAHHPVQQAVTERPQPVWHHAPAPTLPVMQPSPAPATDMRRLEALVAVAAVEGQRH